MALPIYIQADTAVFDGPLDLRRSETPEFWSGTDVDFKIAVYEFGSLKSVSKFKSLTVEIKAKQRDGSRPLPGAPALMSKTTTGFNDDLTATDWAAFTDCHATVSFTAAESTVAVGTHWLVISAVRRTDDGEENLTLAAGEIIVAQDGHGPVGEVEVPDCTAYTKDVSDTRYARAVSGSAVFVAANGGSDATGVRGRADLPFATLAAAFSAASAGDVVFIAPGTYAAVVVGKSLTLRFAPGVMLSGALTIAASGVALGGGFSAATGAVYSLTGDGSWSVVIDGLLTVNKPVSSALTVTGGLLIDTSSATLAHPGLSDAALVAETARAVATEAAKAPLDTPVVSKAGTACTLARTDAASLVRCTASDAVSITVPAFADVAFPVGTTILVRQAGTGPVTLLAAPGVTLNTSRTLRTRAQHATIALTKVAADEWDVTGERALS